MKETKHFIFKKLYFNLCYLSDKIVKNLWLSSLFLNQGKSTKGKLMHLGLVRLLSYLYFDRNWLTLFFTFWLKWLRLVFCRETNSPQIRTKPPICCIVGIAVIGNRCVCNLDGCCDLEYFNFVFKCFVISNKIINL